MSPEILGRDGVLARLSNELKHRYRCHTVILYGSRARGDHSPGSDYDLVGICRSGTVRHLARRMGHVYVDTFVYPEGKAKPLELLRIRGGRVLFRKHDFGKALLDRIERRYARGPKPLTSDEIQLRKHWAKKMIDRAKRGDTEGYFRRAWLLNALLEDYFVLRGKWYEGPKVSLGWLKQHEPEVASLFAKALRPDARLSLIAKLASVVAAVSGRQAPRSG